jgi:hypothetical protein
MNFRFDDLRKFIGWRLHASSLGGLPSPVKAVCPEIFPEMFGPNSAGFQTPLNHPTGRVTGKNLVRPFLVSEPKGAGASSFVFQFFATELSQSKSFTHRLKMRNSATPAVRHAFIAVAVGVLALRAFLPATVARLEALL